MYIAMDCIMRNVFSLRVFKQMDAYTSACIHSFFLTLTRGKCFLTIKYSSILKVRGLYTMSVQRKYVFAVRC